MFDKASFCASIWSPFFCRSTEDYSLATCFIHNLTKRNGCCHACRANDIMSTRMAKSWQSIILCQKGDGWTWFSRSFSCNKGSFMACDCFLYCKAFFFKKIDQQAGGKKLFIADFRI